MEVYRVKFFYRNKHLSPSLDVDRDNYIVQSDNIEELERKAIEHAKETANKCGATIASIFLDKVYGDEIEPLAFIIVRNIDKEATVEKIKTSSYPKSKK
jgi:predicted small metal-binding protein